MKTDDRYSFASFPARRRSRDMVASKGCVALGVLILIGCCYASHPYFWHDEIGDDCRIFTLFSDPWTVDKKVITDAWGQPAIITEVKVLSQFSQTRCKQDHSFFVTESTVLAKKGCSAKFKACFLSEKEGKVGKLSVPKGCSIVRLLSRLNREDRKLQERPVASMTLLRRFRDGRDCNRKEDYGFKGRLVFARNGCRADFKVCFADYDESVYSSEGHTRCQHITMKSSRYEKNIRKIVDENRSPVKILSLKLVEQLSRPEDCRERVTYYFRGSFVAVKSGCSGKFQVCYRKPEDSYASLHTVESHHGSKCKVVKLESWGPSEPDWKKIERHRGEPAYVESIELIKPYSKAPCKLGKTYGFRGYKVYATDACRGLFLVCYW